MADVAAFLDKIENYRPICANCGQAVTPVEKGVLVTCGHVFHPECWDLHVKACEVKLVPCTCPSCATNLRR